MFELYADKNRLSVRQRETLTSGSVNVNTARFEFSPDWEGLAKTAVFRAGEQSFSVALEESGECAVPWEALTTPGVRLDAGVYGARGAETVLPTVWADLGYILTGAVPGEESRPPTPELWPTDHRLLSHRGAEKQHPIGAIDGLEEELKRIPPAAEAITNQELEELLK